MSDIETVLHNNRLLRFKEGTTRCWLTHHNTDGCVRVCPDWLTAHTVTTPLSSSRWCLSLCEAPPPTIAGSFFLLGCFLHTVPDSTDVSYSKNQLICGSVDPVVTGSVSWVLLWLLSLTVWSFVLYWTSAAMFSPKRCNVTCVLSVNVTLKWRSRRTNLGLSRYVSVVVQ